MCVRDQSPPRGSATCTEHVALPRNASRDGRAPRECLCVVVDDQCERTECDALIARGAPALRYAMHGARIGP